MVEFPIRTPAQLSAVLQAFRKQAGMTQQELAMRLGVTQQTLSTFERNAQKVSAERLLTILSLLGVELVMRPKNASGNPQSTDSENW